ARWAHLIGLAADEAGLPDELSAAGGLAPELRGIGARGAPTRCRPLGFAWVSSDVLKTNTSLCSSLTVAQPGWYGGASPQPQCGIGADDGGVAPGCEFSLPIREPHST
ncbi:MAG: hypothetical protein QOC80_1694, partial [Frankiaceae bacterium]|nr:hypothetical protein [Frankiaceae bacterium]